MKILVVYYSKTGTTKKLAQRLCAEFKADGEELVDKKKRSGLIGWLIGGRDAMKRVPTEIESTRKNPADYDVVLIGGPLWGFKGIAPASRTFLLQNKDKIKRVAFFMTRGGKTSSDPALNELKDVYGKTVIATLDIRQAELNKPETDEQIKTFVKMINNSK
ncbi:MAG TPA: flavodoxin [Chitinispirillaceae bacterium]|nr:flavodoxin [Chitinispirillaceae bacterium]